jgi:hypothetical protein
VARLRLERDAEELNGIEIDHLADCEHLLHLQVETAAGQAATKDLRLARQAVVTIEEQRPHDRLVALLVAQGEEVRHQIRPAERSPGREAPAGQATGDLVGGDSRRICGFSARERTLPSPLQDGMRVR